MNIEASQELSPPYVSKLTNPVGRKEVLVSASVMDLTFRFFPPKIE